MTIDTLCTELDTTTGRVALAVRGEKSWHGLEGEEGMILESDSIADIRRKAGLNWEARAATVEYTDNAGRAHTYDERRVIYRDDTGGKLSIVSNQYKIHSVKDITEFFTGFANEKNWPVETMGALYGGRIIWAQARLPADYQIKIGGAKSSDTVDAYARFQTSFDTSCPTTFVTTGTRQVCKNTMRMIDAEIVAAAAAEIAGEQSAKAFKTIHTVDLNVEALHRAAGMVGEQYRVTAELYNKLAGRRVKSAEREEFICKLFGVDPADVNAINPETGKPMVSTRTRKMMNEIADAYVNSPGATLKSAKDTAWGLLNAVTYWADHVAPVAATKGDDKDAARIASSWYGINARTKADAQFFAAELAGCESLLVAA